MDSNSEKPEFYAQNVDIISDDLWMCANKTIIAEKLVAKICQPTFDTRIQFEDFEVGTRMLPAFSISFFEKLHKNVQCYTGFEKCAKILFI
jgi:hypothetical protein